MIGADITGYEGLLALMVSELPGASDAVMLQQLKIAGRELCVESGIWWQELEAIDLVAGQDKYDLCPCADAVIHTILRVTIDGQMVDENDYIHIGQNDNVIKLKSTSSYDSTGRMVVVAKLRPRLNSVEIPEWLVDRYGEGIALLATAKLMLQMRKPYTSPNAGLMKRDEYKATLTNACNDFAEQWAQYTGEEGISA